MQDPSNGIQRELLPHVHLVSTYRFPALPTLHPDKVAEWLINAPQITRDKAPFYWTYLDRPQDGMILLVWQSLSLGTDFPSDGNVYPPMETAFQLEVAGGYTLEMYHHKAGYQPGEAVATHARRRYRLLPSKFPNPNAPTPDPSLWIVHYSTCEPNERIPAAHIPIDMRVQSIMQTRAHLYQQGQLVQKDFMLHDRANWPSINFPRGPSRGPQALFGRSAPPPQIPPQMAYNLQHQQQQGQGPAPKRARLQPPNQSMPGGPDRVHEVDDEEDTQRGDFFDHTTPREVSTGRYRQNHEWMEEILSSPYGIHQIIPTDLGLGVRGELATLTDGFFDAPYDPGNDVEKHQYVGRLDPEKAEEFRKKANERIAETNKEIEKMKAKHERRLAKFKKNSLLSLAEMNLRTSVTDPLDIGPEYWRLEGKIDDEDSEDGKARKKTPSKVEDILRQVEASLGRSAVAVEELRRIQDGGFEEAAPASPSPIIAAPSPLPPQVHSLPHSLPQSVNGSTPRSGGMGDMDMGNSAAGLLDQYHTGISSNATPGSNFGNTPQPLLMHSHSEAGTPAMHVPSAHPTPHISPEPQAAPVQDTTMSESHDQANSADGSTPKDWIVVPPGGVSPKPSTIPTAPAQASDPTASTSTSAPQIPSTNPSGTQAAEAEDNQNTPFTAPSPNDFSDLGDLDSAGDAMARYTQDGGDDDLALGDMDVDVDGDGGEGMDDSAFGEAFHGMGRDEEGEGEGDGL